MRHDANALVFVDTVVLKRWRRADVGIGWCYTRRGFAMSVFSETPRFRAERLSRNFVKWLKRQNAVTNVLGGRVRNRFLETRFRTLAFSQREVVPTEI